MANSPQDDAAGKPTKKQDKRAADIKGKAQHELHAEFENLLQSILTKPHLWFDRSLQYLRNFVATVSRGIDRHKFTAVEGDEALTVTDEKESSTTITTKFISSLAAGKNLPDDVDPILSVLSRKTGFHDHLHHESMIQNQKQKVKLTHLTLLDGDNNQIHARLATHLADIGRQLVEGDIIKLELFTPLTYHVKEDSPLMPALFILQYSRVGHAPVPLQKSIQAMLRCEPTKQPPTEAPAYNILDPLTQPPPECTFDKRLCRKFGVNFIGRCICEEIPVDKRNLEIIAEDCYLVSANDGIDKLKNKNKRIMLYWWYATNIYSLNGKGNRGKLPDCLEYAIKTKYPEKDSSDWTGYKDGSKPKKKKIQLN